MRKILRKIFFNDEQIKEFQTVTINIIKEKVYLKAEQILIDISENHWLLCLEPIVFGVWIEKDRDEFSLKESALFKMYFKDAVYDNKQTIEKNCLAILILNFFDTIEEENGMLLLLKLKTSNIYRLNIFNILLLFFTFYKKPEISFSKFKALVAAFSYPRKVYVISFRENDYYNIFPMDLLGKIAAYNKFVFGLRHSNAALQGIMQTKKIVVSEASYKHKTIMYQLGKHHSTNPPEVYSLPFKIISSKNFDFYIPEWVESYKEMKIIKTLNLGSQMLLLGEVVSESILKSQNGSLYHIHFLHYVHKKKKGELYQLV